MGRFETEMLTADDNLVLLEELNRQWVNKAMGRTKEKRIILDLDSFESPVHGEQEGSAYNGHFNIRCFHLLFCFNQHGDCEGAMLRPGNVYSADIWKDVLDPIVKRYEQTRRKYFLSMPLSQFPIYRNILKNIPSCMPSGFQQIKIYRKKSGVC